MISENIGFNEKNITIEPKSTNILGQRKDEIQLMNNTENRMGKASKNKKGGKNKQK